jgi:hypothetical protein
VRIDLWYQLPQSSRIQDGTRQTVGSNLAAFFNDSYTDRLQTGAPGALSAVLGIKQIPKVNGSTETGRPSPYKQHINF